MTQRRPWAAWAEREGDAIRAAGQWRSPRVFDAAGPHGALADGTAVTAFASNDYLGLTQHPAVVAAAAEAAGRWGAGSGAARLVVGSRPVHADLEDALAAWKGTQAAVVFPTGYQANVGVLTTFGVAGATILSDEVNHASIIDGCRLARARVEVFRHGDAEHAESMLRAVEGPAVVVTDTVFSMDGDVAPVDALAEACARHGALLVLDEAHAVLGPHVDPASLPCDSMVVGTMSKTLGVIGGFAAAHRALVDLVVNRARSYIFTTAMPPTDAAAALAAVQICAGDEGAGLRARLRAVVDAVAPGHPSPIVPVIVGAEEAALDLAAALLERGLLVPAIRPPTVAPGTSRLRVALSAAHTDAQVAALVAGLDACRPGWREALGA